MNIICKRAFINLPFIERLSTHVVSQLLSRVQGLDRDTAWRMYNGAVGQFALTRNQECWGADLFPQLTGVKTWQDSWYPQGAGKIAITPRHMIQVGHWNAGWDVNTESFTGANGEYFQTGISVQYPPATDPMVFEGRSCDLQVYLMDEEFPAWVHIMPIAQLNQSMLDTVPNYTTTDINKLLPMVSVSQAGTPGDIQKLYINNLSDYDAYDTIRNLGSNADYNSKFNKRNPDPDLHPYFYDVYVGDSGMPVFLLINNTLYLSHVVSEFNFGLQPVWEPWQAAYINELIARADAAGGISTGYTVNVVPIDSLQVLSSTQPLPGNYDTTSLSVSFVDTSGGASTHEVEVAATLGGPSTVMPLGLGVDITSINALSWSTAYNVSIYTMSSGVRGGLAQVVVYTAPRYAPTSVAVVTTGVSTQTVSWVAASPPPVTGYIVEHSTDGTTWNTQAFVNVGVNSLSVTGLAGGTLHYYRVRSRNSNPSPHEDGLSPASFATSASTYADTIAPILTGVTSVSSGSTTASMGVTTNKGSGTLYWFVSSSSTPPSATILKAGTGSAFFTSDVITDVGTKTKTATGLTTGSTYYLHVLHRDSAGNDSLIANSSSFIPAAPVLVNLITSATPSNGSRNDITGTVGSVISSPTTIQVGALGRYLVAPLVSTCRIGIWTIGGTLIGYVTTPVGGTSNAWTKTDLATPITLTAGTTYLLGFEVVSGGDAWWEFDNDYTFSIEGLYVANAREQTTAFAAPLDVGAAGYMRGPVTLYY